MSSEQNPERGTEDVNPLAVHPEIRPESIPPEPGPPRSMTSKVLHYCFALFTLEVGLFLLIFPWTDKWLFSFVQDYHPALRDMWDDPYFRGALSGLGAVNVYLALYDFVRVIRGR